MAGTVVGSIFAEIGIDYSPATRAQAQLLQDARSTSTNLEQNFKNLGVTSAATFDLMRQKIANSYEMIARSGQASAADILRAEQAKHEQLTRLNEQQYGKQTSMLDSLKANWVAASAAIVAAWMGVNAAVSMMDEGAKALRSESAFKIMADAAGVNSERLIESMKLATKETIDDSELMQKAVKLMTLSYDPSQIERFSKVVITASQIAGTTSAQAYDELGDAIANRMPKALVRMGAVTREQMVIVNEAIRAGASSTVLFELAISNLELKQLKLKGTQDEATIALQQFHTQVNETKESMGKGLIVAVQALYGGFQWVASGALNAAYGIAKFMEYSAKIGEKTSGILGPTKQMEEMQAASEWWKNQANALKLAGEDLAVKAAENITQTAAISEKASRGEISAAQSVVDALMKKLKATTDNGEASKKAAKERDEAYYLSAKSILASDEALDAEIAKITLEQERRNEEAAKKAVDISYDEAKEQLKIELDWQTTSREAWEAYYKYVQGLAEAKAKQISQDYEDAKQREQIVKDELDTEREAWAYYYKYLAEERKKEEGGFLDTTAIAKDAFAGMSSAISTSIKGVIQGTQTLQEAFANVGETIALGLVDSVVKRGLDKVGESLIGLLPSVGKGLGGILDTVGGWIGFAEGGVVPGRDPRDTIPALLRPGEIVLKPEIAEQFQQLLDIINPSYQLTPVEVSAIAGPTAEAGAIGVVSPTSYFTASPLEAATAAYAGELVTPATSFTGMVAPLVAPALAVASTLYGAWSNSQAIKQAEQIAGHNYEILIDSIFRAAPEIIPALQMGNPEALQAMADALAGTNFIETAFTRQIAQYGIGGDVARAITMALYPAKPYDINYSDSTGGSRAMGGPVWPGWSGTVGELGPERLDIGPGGYGYVTPSARSGGGSAGGGEVVVHAHLYIDGKAVTDAVVRGIRSGDEDLVKYLRRAVN